MQWELLEQSKKYIEERGTDEVGGESALEVLTRWEQVLGMLEDDPMQLANQLDWVAKYRLVQSFRERHDIEWDDARIAALDIQYHDLDQRSPCLPA